MIKCCRPIRQTLLLLPFPESKRNPKPPQLKWPVLVVSKMFPSTLVFATIIELVDPDDVLLSVVNSNPIHWSRNRVVATVPSPVRYPKSPKRLLYNLEKTHSKLEKTHSKLEKTHSNLKRYCNRKSLRNHRSLLSRDVAKCLWDRKIRIPLKV